MDVSKHIVGQQEAAAFFSTKNNDIQRQQCFLSWSVELATAIRKLTNSDDLDANILFEILNSVVVVAVLVSGEHKPKSIATNRCWLAPSQH
ncbi:hypothetical protein ACQ4M3_39475 [Leptolyngbya sp. AN03gr2]|uniref:hypothetical protein n=1 Tax=unclassified Leptolyngbya TaxID=2650499 RepID=UPI003D3213B1